MVDSFEPTVSCSLVCVPLALMLTNSVSGCKLVIESMAVLALTNDLQAMTITCPVSVALFASDLTVSRPKPEVAPVTTVTVRLLLLPPSSVIINHQRLTIALLDFKYI